MTTPNSGGGTNSPMPTSSATRAATGSATGSASEPQTPQTITDGGGGTVQLSKATGLVYSTDHHLVNAEPTGGWPAEVQRNIDAAAAGEINPPVSATGRIGTASRAGVSGEGSGSTPAATAGVGVAGGTGTAGTGTAGTAGTAGSTTGGR